MADNSWKKKMVTIRMSAGQALELWSAAGQFLGHPDVVHCRLDSNRKRMAYAGWDKLGKAWADIENSAKGT